PKRNRHGQQARARPNPAEGPAAHRPPGPWPDAGDHPRHLRERGVRGDRRCPAPAADRRGGQRPGAGPADSGAGGADAGGALRAQRRGPDLPARLSALFPFSGGCLLQAPQEHRHFPFRLLVAAPARHLQAVVPGLARLLEHALALAGLAQQLPRGGVVGVEAQALLQVLGGALGVAAVEIGLAQAEAQQGVVHPAGQQSFQRLRRRHAIGLGEIPCQKNVSPTWNRRSTSRMYFLSTRNSITWSPDSITVSSWAIITSSS